MADTDTNIQASALATPIDGLSTPSINLRGQGATHTDKRQPVKYNTNVDTSRGPFLADTQNNIDLFTEIYNTTTVENTVNGVVHNTLVEFLHAVLGTKLTTNVTAVCVKYDVYSFGAPDWSGNVPSYVIPEEMVNDSAAMAGKNKFQFSLNTAVGNPAWGMAGKIANHDSMLGKWVLAADIIAAMTTPFGTPAATLVENTICASQNFSSTFETFSDTRDNYGTPIFLDESVKNIQGVNASNPPGTIGIQLPTSDTNIRSILVDVSELAAFSTRVIDIVVNSDSIQVGPSDPTRLIKVFNTKKFNFTDDTVALSARAPTVLQSLNLIDRKAEKNFALADSVESAVWSTGVGDWRNSQSDDPSIAAQLSAAGYTESGSQALRRLNLIPVTSGDKIQVLSADSTGSPVLVVDTSSQVNLLEAIWTSWKNIMELNTDIYGVTATHMPELSSIALNEALSGQSVIEILNNFHTTLQQIGSGGSGLTLSGLSDFVELSGRVHTNSTNISTLSTNMMLMSACCGTNAYNLSALSAEVTRLSKTDTLSSLITMLSTIDTLTLIQRLSGLTQDFTTILQLSTDVYNLSGSIGIQNEEIERLKLVLQPLYDVDLYDLEFCCETNRQSISALELRMDTLSLSALSGLNDIFNAVNLSTYITRLSSIEQTVAEFEDVRNIINNVTTNTINISSNVTTLSALSSNVYSQIQELRDLIPGSTDAGELSALTNIINSITDISVFLQQLSTDERMIDLELCCEENRVNIGNFTTTLSVLSSAVNNNIITINSLSGLMSQPAGVVLTTKNQTVSGHKTFKNTLVVESSGHFHNNMTLGDMSQPKIFNICSDNGTTLININGLPSQLNINELSPGDMYTVDINGHKVLAIK